MISDLNGSLGSRQFLNVANERTCFASCASTFKSTGLFTCLKPFSSPEAALLLVSTKNRDLWPRPTAFRF